MKMVIFLLLLYLSCPIGMVFGKDPVIIDGPDTVITEEGATVQFSCIVEFSGEGTREVKFFVNDVDTNAATGFNQSTAKNLNPTTLGLNLTAIALSQYNNTKVYCRALYTDANRHIFGPVFSEDAVLIVKDAIGLSSTISSQISELVISPTMSDDSMWFSPVVELSTSGLSPVSRISSTMAPSSTMRTSSVELPESSSTDPTSPGVSNNTPLIVGLVVSSLIVLVVIGIRCLYCYCKIKEPHNDILPVRFTKPVPVTVHCLEGVLCLPSNSTIIEEQTELRDIADDKLVNNTSHQETAMSSDNDTNLAAVPTAVKNKSEGTLVEVHVHVHVPHEIITERATCENDLKVKSEEVENSYIHQDVRKTIDNDTDSSLVTIDYKLSVERNEPIGFVNGSDVITRNCTGSSSTYVSHFVKPPGKISKEFDSSHKETDIDMDFLDSVGKQCTKETTNDIAHGPHSKIIKSSSCPSVIYFNPVPPISSEPPPQIPHLVHQIQTPSIKTPSFFYIDNDKAMDNDTPYVHNSLATPRGMSVLQIEDDNYPWKHCDMLPSQMMMNNLSLMRTDADSSVDCIKEDKTQKPFLSLQNDTNSDDVG